MFFKMKKKFFEILMYINGVMFITSFFGFFFLSSELNETTVKILAIMFIVACIIGCIDAHILIKKVKEEKECQI